MKYIIIHIFLILVISTNAQNNSDTAKLQHYPVDVENKFIKVIENSITETMLYNLGVDSDSENKSNYKMLFFILLFLFKGFL